MRDRWVEPFLGPALPSSLKELPEATQAALGRGSGLEHRPLGGIGGPCSFSIYTDGSGGGAKVQLAEVAAASFLAAAGSGASEEMRAAEAAWALVVVAVWDDGAELVVGTLAGRVEVGLFAIKRPTNNTAELSAIIWAVLWVLRAAPGVPVTIRPDSMIGVDTAEGRAHPLVLEGPASVVRNLVILARTHHIVHFEHVEAHCGHAWNEYADALAAAAGIGLLDLPPALELQLAPGEAMGLEWAWVEEAPPEVRRQCPLVARGSLVDDCRRRQPLLGPVRGVPDPAAPRPPARGGRGEGPGAGQDLRVLSFNVLTLRGERRRAAGEEVPLPSRQVVFAKQLDEIGVMVAGIQEARTRDAGVRQVGCFTVFSSAASSEGQGAARFGSMTA